MRLRIPLASFALAGLLAACGGATQDSPPAGEPTETGAPQDDVDDGDGDDDLDAAIDFAVEDAAADRGTTEEEIEVVTFEEVTWPDEALGCAEQNATDGNPVEGYFIELDAAGDELLYHGEQGEMPFHCEEPLTDVRG